MSCTGIPGTAFRVANGLAREQIAMLEQHGTASLLLQDAARIIPDGRSGFAIYTCNRCILSRTSRAAYSIKENAMFLKDTTKNDLLEVLTLNDLFDPFCTHLIGRYQHGEELQDPEKFNKAELSFPSGEPLPRCWIDAHYRDNELQR
jgi:hypothetical protein